MILASTALQGSKLLLLLLLPRSRFSRVRLCAAPWTAARQAPPSMGFSSKNTSGLPFPSLPKLLGDMRNMKLSNQAGWPFWTEHKKSSWLQQILEKPESSWPPIRACPDSREVFQRFMLIIFSLTFSLYMRKFCILFLLEKYFVQLWNLLNMFFKILWYRV